MNENSDRENFHAVGTILLFIILQVLQACLFSGHKIDLQKNGLLLLSHEIGSIFGSTRFCEHLSTQEAQANECSGHGMCSL